MNDDEPKVFSSSFPKPVAPEQSVAPTVTAPQPVFEESVVPTVSTAEPALPYAPWISRVGASLLDSAFELAAVLMLSLVFSLVVSVFISVLSRTVPALASLADLGEGDSSLFAQALGSAFFILSISVTLFNRVVMQWYYGASIGKRIVGLKLLTEKGESVTFLRVLARHFATWFSSLVLFVGYLMPLWMPKRQTLHDYICKTVVVQKK